LERDLFSEDQLCGGVLGVAAVGLALLRTVDAGEANAFRVGVVENFDDIAVEDRDDISCYRTSRNRE
jgi:hypothetical protein